MVSKVNPESNRMNNFAISSADIGSAMERSGAALKAAGKILPVYIEICI